MSHLRTLCVSSNNFCNCAYFTSICFAVENINMDIIFVVLCDFG